MYEFIRGNLIEKTPTRAVIEAGGIGYEIRVPVSTFSKLPALGEPVRLLTHFVVREDVQQLYGFFTPEERDLFRLLISVSGIGPKLGITLLSGLTISELISAIRQGMVPTLTAVPGIGKKIAERVIVELKEKVVLQEMQETSTLINAGQDESIFNDALQALMELGYKKQDARTALQKTSKELSASGLKPTVSELIRKALKYV